ncbi:XRE family transcriptional regulator [Salinicola endophyticus]|uniref:XRE family transcriptional regulator n=1 Tax=Salinicola endophyticus TaxID=1949083 RepID=A0AB74UAF8_9GAMM
MDSISRHTLGQHLQTLRQARGLSLSQLAAEAKVAKSNLSRLEQGDGNPTLDTLWRLARQLGVPFGTLVAPLAAAVDDAGASVQLIMQSRSDVPVDAYLMRLAPHHRREAEAHTAGTRETVQLIEGSLTVGPPADSRQLDVGECYTFASDVPHAYLSGDSGAALLVTIVYLPEPAAHV